MKLIENAHIKLMAKAMDAYSLRQKATASNIANIDTPGYKKLSVSFEDHLRSIGPGRVNDQSIDEVKPEITVSEEVPVLEDELLEMADTQIRVQMVSRALRHSFEQIRSGIRGRSS